MSNFYSPLSKSGYLTPLQRKKLREKRESAITPIEEPTPKNSQGIKKQKLRKSSEGSEKCNKPRKSSEIKSTKTKITREKNVKENCYSVSDLVAHSNTDNSKEKRFFKCRSPQHLKKTKFSMPLKYKKNCLDFGNDKDIVSAKSRQNVNRNNECSKVQDTESENVNLSGKQHVVENSSANIVQVCDANKYTSPTLPLTEVNFDKTEAVKENSVDDPFGFDLELDEILLARQEKARAEARKRLNELQQKTAPDSDIENAVKETNIKTPSPKYYPIFNRMDKEAKTPNSRKSSLKKTATQVKDTSKGSEQMIIDAGQKEIGARQCKTCNMLYTIGTEDELHSKYHDTFLINLRFPGWKNERVVGQFNDGRIIQVNDTDKHMKLKKVEEVLFIANRDLGFPTAGFPVRPNVTFLLFVSTAKRVEGCVVAESIKSACPVVLNDTAAEVDAANKKIWKLGNWYASSNSVPAICGINRIWVSYEFRRQKVASRLVDCLRQNFLYGYVIELNELAFTDPSPDGREFAASYTGTNNFLVYK